MRVIPALTIALVAAATSDASVAQLSMTCENPRQEYQITYDRTLDTFHAGDTQYRVLAKEETADRLVIVGLTVNDGPTFRAHFRPYKKMEFYADNQLFQTDGCR